MKNHSIKINFSVKTEHGEFHFANVPVVTYNSGQNYYSTMAGVSSVMRQYIKQRWGREALISIRSQSFSGGDSVSVRLNEGFFGTENQLRTAKREIENMFERGSFNGMEDIYEYRSGVMPIHATINGQVIEFSTKYVM